MDGEIKSFQDRKGLKEYVTTRSTPQEILRGYYKRGKFLRISLNRNIEAIYREKDFNDNTMSIKTYLSIITLNVNDLNVPIKRHRVADWIK